MRALVFDFGGVLFRWQPYELLCGTLPELAVDEAAARALAPRIFEAFTPQSDWAQFDLGHIDEQTLAARVSARVGCSQAQMRRLIGAIPAHLAPLPDTVTLLQRLQQAGHRLYFLSNMPLPYAAHLESSHTFLRAFRDGIFSARVGLMKPDAAIFVLAAERFGIDPAASVFVDDHAGNVQAARRLGWQALQFSGAAPLAAALQAQGWL